MTLGKITKLMLCKRNLKWVGKINQKQIKNTNKKDSKYQ